LLDFNRILLGISAVKHHAQKDREIFEIFFQLIL